jgi:hypothetical protein
MDYYLAPTVFYRSKDAPKNFRLKISIKREILTELSEPQKSKGGIDNKDSAKVGEPSSVISKGNVWSETISWYQKQAFDPDTGDKTRQVIIFSLTDQDEFFDYEEMNRTLTTSSSETLPAAYKILTFSNKQIQNSTTIDGNNRGPYLEHSFQSMFIRAAFLMKPDFLYWKQHTLCSIRMYSDGSIEMRVRSSLNYL